MQDYLRSEVDDQMDYRRIPCLFFQESAGSGPGVSLQREIRAQNPGKDWLRPDTSWDSMRPDVQTQSREAPEARGAC